MKVYITESQLRHIKESEEQREITFEEFFQNAKQFLKDLLVKPYEADVSELFKIRHISKEDLIAKLKKIGLLKSEEDIIEVPIEEARLRAKHTIKYKIPRKRFMEKMRELHKELFEATNFRSVFSNEDEEIEKIMQNDTDNMYHKCGGVGRNF